MNFSGFPFIVDHIVTVVEPSTISTDFKAFSVHKIEQLESQKVEEALSTYLEWVGSRSGKSVRYGSTPNGAVYVGENYVFYRGSDIYMISFSSAFEEADRSTINSVVNSFNLK